MMLLLGCVKECIDADFELLVELADDLICARIVEVDVLLSIMQLGSWINRADSKRVHSCRLDGLKEVALLAGKHSHAIKLVQQEDTLSARVQLDTLLVNRTDDHKLVKDADDWAVVARPAKLTCISLKGLLAAEKSLHISLHHKH